MSSFSCQYQDFKTYKCLKLKKECVPGMKGCVLRNKVEFAVPVEERIKKGKDKEKKDG